MNQLREETHRTLKRLLANGPLTGVPKRPSDQHLLVILAAAQFEPETTYLEGGVNEILKAWLQTFCDPYGIDHVTLRRLLVDSGLLTRTSSGSTYRVHRESLGELESIAAIEPARVLAEVRSHRASRKRQAARLGR